VVPAIALLAMVLGCPADDVTPDPPDDPPPDPPPEDYDPVDYVNPLIGAGGIGFGIAASFPGPTLPFGQVRPGPDTSLASSAMPILHCGGYYYEDEYIKGFSHIHLHGVGAAEFGNILFMPTLGMDESRTESDGYRSAFFHDDEVVEAGYYAVTLDDTGIRAELTATTHAAMQRYTFPASDEAVVLMDLTHTLDGATEIADVQLDPDTGEVTGHVYNNDGFVGRVGGAHFHFVSRFDRLPSDWGTWTIDAEGAVTMLDGGTDGEGDRLGAWLQFDTAAGEQVVVRTGISVIDLDHARANLDEEIGESDFDTVREAARDTWNDELAVVEVTGGTEDERIMFYTALYHALMMPATYTEAGGEYLGFDFEVHDSDGFTYYTEFSLWDTFRTEHPLLILLEPERQLDMLISLERMLEQGGGLPQWALHTGDTGSMIGTPVDQVIAGSYLKGIRGYDVEAMLDEMIDHTTGEATEGDRSCMDEYLDLGYVAMDGECDKGTSRTLEFAYNDFAVAQLADALGRTAEADELYEQSLSYVNLWSEETQFFTGRMLDGSFDPDFYPENFNSPDLCEASAWQYLWHVQHDVDGLAELMGGPDVLVERLDGLFEDTIELQEELMEGVPSYYYWHGNEPDMHAAYLFDQVGRPDLTQKWVRWIMEDAYTPDPDGIPGNDDCGTLSSWYVFSALGFYPIPATDTYLIGSPIFTSATVHLPDGDLVITADGAGPDALYIQSAAIGGAPLDEPWIRHDQIAAGGELEFVMGDTPSDWGA
jgi:predicted alpha-1,2-mannosidase